MDDSASPESASRSNDKIPCPRNCGVLLTTRGGVLNRHLKTSCPFRHRDAQTMDLLRSGAVAGEAQTLTRAAEQQRAEIADLRTRLAVAEARCDLYETVVAGLLAALSTNKPHPAE